MKRQRGELSKPINAYLCKFVRSKQNESENKTWTSCIDLFWISLVNINFKRILLVARHAVRHEIAGKNWRSLIDLYDICSIHFSVITNLFNDDCTEKVTRTTFHVEHHVVALNSNTPHFHAQQYVSHQYLICRSNNNSTKGKEYHENSILSRPVWNFHPTVINDFSKTSIFTTAWWAYSSTEQTIL